MKSQSVLIAIIVMLCAVNGALIWFFAVQNKPVESSFYEDIFVPAFLDMEKRGIEKLIFSQYLSQKILLRNVKTIRTIDYWCPDSDIDDSQKEKAAHPEEYGKSVFQFNKNGNLISAGSYSIEGKLLPIELTFEYDEKGNRISDRVDGSLETTYQYDEEGNRIGWTEYIITGEIGSSGVLKYNYLGVIEEIRRSRSGRHSERYVYVYDPFTRLLLQRRYYNPPVHLCRRYIYIYNDKGHKVEQIELYEGGECGNQEIYQYDDRGNLIEKSFCWRGNYRNKNIYLYDEKDNVIEARTFRQDSSYYKESFHYNEQGYLIEKLSCTVWIDPQSKKESVSTLNKTVFEYEFYPVNIDNSNPGQGTFNMRTGEVEVVERVNSGDTLPNSIQYHAMPSHHVGMTWHGVVLSPEFGWEAQQRLLPLPYSLKSSDSFQGAEPALFIFPAPFPDDTFTKSKPQGDLANRLLLERKPDCLCPMPGTNHTGL